MSETSSKHNLSEADLIHLTRTVMLILDGWELSNEQQLTLLNLPEKTRKRELVRFREGSVCLPLTEDIIERVENILCINSALITSFPHNEAMARKWISTSNRRFNKKTPISIMLKDGLEGFYQVKGHLDCTENWF